MQRPTLPWLVLLAWALLLLSCAPGEEVSTAEVIVAPVAELPSALDDPAWRSAPLYRAPMVLQDLVEPRLLEPSTSEVEVKALTDGQRVAFLLRWADDSVDDRPGASRFSDGCAIQLPRVTAAEVPAPQMGEDGRAVEIVYWRASWQAAVDGREDTIQALYPDASIDHYPFEAAPLEAGSPEQSELAAQYAPARRLGHAMEGPRERAVEDLLAEGPGTLAPAPEQRSHGSGRRSAEGWEVVIVRPLPDGLEAGGRTQIAFAVWDGAQEEVGARKMRSIWFPLHRLEEET